LSYIISDHHNPSNHPFYFFEDEIESFVFHLNDEESEITFNNCRNQSLTDQQNEVWKMYFDGYSSKEGYGVGILLISPSQEVITLSYKMEFETPKNIAKYEALVLGLRASKGMAIDNLAFFGDSELMINQVKNIYQDKQLRLKQYRNEVCDLVDNFFLTFNISFIPRE
jgi:hypothetical protein